MLLCNSHLFLFMLQCQWPRHFSEVLANTLLIPRQKKFQFPLRGFAAQGELIFFASGFGGYSPIPPRNA